MNPRTQKEFLILSKYGSEVKVSACNAGDLGWIPGFDPWIREDPLEKEMATHSSILARRSPWMESLATVYGVTKSWTRLSDFTFTFIFE